MKRVGHEPKHIKQANHEQRQKNREQRCDRCGEYPCKCDAGEKL